MSTSIRRARTATFVLALLSFVVFALPAQAAAVVISLSATNGSGVFDAGTACADGGSGSSWVYDYSGNVAAGQFSDLPGTFAFHLDLHSEASGSPATYSSAWLHGDQTIAAITNSRGRADFAMTSGDCGTRTLAFNGSIAAGSGNWTVTGSGAYRNITGTGTFSISGAQVAAGSGNALSVTLDGNVAVGQPALDISVAGATWNKGWVAAVSYRIANTGPGDAFGVQVLSASSPTAGVTPLTAMPLSVGDVAAGTSQVVSVAYRVTRSTCKPNGNCSFDTSLSFDMLDALDDSTVGAQSVLVSMPSR